MVVAATRRSVMTLFSDEQGLRSHIVRAVIAEKGVTVNIHNLKPDELPEDLIELNPYHSTPTLIDRELVLYQSQIVIEYLDERFPHPPLMPVYPVARAKSRLMMHRIEQDWHTLAEKIESATAEEAKEAKKELKESLVSIAPIFSDKEYFLNDEFSLVDCCLAPLIWRLSYWGIKLPKSAAQHINPYANRVFSRPSFQSCLTEAEKEMYEEVAEAA